MHRNGNFKRLHCCHSSKREDPFDIIHSYLATSSHLISNPCSKNKKPCCVRLFRKCFEPGPLIIRSWSLIRCILIFDYQILLSKLLVWCQMPSDNQISEGIWSTSDDHRTRPNDIIYVYSISPENELQLSASFLSSSLSYNKLITSKKICTTLLFSLY